ncbi:MAG TPA: MGMT family protein [Candidatus Saccharimonadales bacterium]|nr:MGMT family protein [Candidatus Saccharimonadales bacterium]
MGRVDEGFVQRVYDLVATIPSGKVMTYGQVATLCGYASAAWEVGQIAHSGPSELPWQRVVNKQGGMASGWPGGPALQQQLLEAEGVDFSVEGKISNLNQILWQPNQTSLL